MQERDNEIVPVRPRRPRRSRPVIIVILLAAAAAVLLALRPWAHARPSADAGTGSGESTDAVEELLGRLAAQITDGMAVNECGPEYASELRSLAREKAEYARQLNFMAEHLEIYPEAAVKAALQGDEKVNFALQIPFRAPDSSGLGEQVTVTPGEIPYLTQYDERWGYHSYGSSVIGITGCGPTCLAMAAAGLTGNTSCNPARVADFAMAAGYYMAGTGTMWSLFTEGAANFGLTGTELPLDVNVMQSSLDSGAVIVASMLPGDFTQSGHFIVIYVYGRDGFLVHDPNSRALSSRSWSYERLSGQIANLWSLSA